jgi:hypothetical protein
VPAADEAYAMFSIAIFALAAALARGIEVGVVATWIKSGSESEPEPKPSSSLPRSLLWSSRGRRWRSCACVKVIGSAERWWLSKKARVQRSVQGHLTVEWSGEKGDSRRTGEMMLVRETWRVRGEEKGWTDDAVNGGRKYGRQMEWWIS